MTNKRFKDDEPALRTIAMPADTNPNGDIFGGWLLSKMDLAGSTTAVKRTGGRVATVAIDAMEFHRPVFVGDEVSCYSKIQEIGTSSITIKVESWRRTRDEEEMLMVTEGVFTYVAIDDSRTPREIEQG